jgi:hypothetical protein
MGLLSRKRETSAIGSFTFRRFDPAEMWPAAYARIWLLCR